MFDILSFLKDLNYQAGCLKGGPKEVETYKLEILVKEFYKTYDQGEVLDHLKLLESYEGKLNLLPNGEGRVRMVDKTKSRGPQDHYFHNLLGLYEGVLGV